MVTTNIPLVTYRHPIKKNGVKTNFLSLVHTHAHFIHKYTQAIASLQSQPQSVCNSSWPRLLHQASRFRWEWPTPRRVMYPGQVIRSAVYSGPQGTHRTGDTLFTSIIVYEGFPWIRCYRLQTQGSQRTCSCCSMSTMGDEAVLTDLNKATLDVVPVARRLDMEKEGSNVGGE